MGVAKGVVHLAADDMGGEHAADDEDERVGEGTQAQAAVGVERMPVPDLCHGRVGQQQEHGNGQLCLSGQLPAYLRIGRLASTVSVGADGVARRLGAGECGDGGGVVAGATSAPNSLPLPSSSVISFSSTTFQSILSPPWEDF
ncbi:hypothetical protein ACIHCQ_43135 [Streptomyces sp. NPDC052236]|uniref:hypothetical protein n=1 Tax=Streptomyces sp. NPDC052236 TaxID=3365686 RepID=UPI0037D00E17